MTVLISSLSDNVRSQDTILKNDGTTISGKIKLASSHHFLIVLTSGQTLSIPAKEVKEAKFAKMENAKGEDKGSFSPGMASAPAKGSFSSAGNGSHSYQDSGMATCTDCGVAVFNNSNLPVTDAQLEVKGKNKAWFSVATFDSLATNAPSFPHTLEIPEGEYEWKYMISGKTLTGTLMIRKGQTVVINIDKAPMSGR